MGIPEHWEQVQVAKALDRAGAVYCAIPNGGFRIRREASMLKAEGVKSGVPDLLIFSVPDGGDFRGVALEMKRANGKPSDLRKSQRAWLDRPFRQSCDIQPLFRDSACFRGIFGKSIRVSIGAVDLLAKPYSLPCVVLVHWTRANVRKVCLACIHR